MRFSRARIRQEGRSMSMMIRLKFCFRKDVVAMLRIFLELISICSEFLLMCAVNPFGKCSQFFGNFNFFLNGWNLILLYVKRWTQNSLNNCNVTWAPLHCFYQWKCCFQTPCLFYQFHNWWLSKVSESELNAMFAKTSAFPRQKVSLLSARQLLLYSFTSEQE